MGSHEKWTKPDGPNDRNNILNGVGINGDDASWSSPLVVNLVTMFVELWMMQESGSRSTHKRSRHISLRDRHPMGRRELCQAWK